MGGEIVDLTADQVNNLSSSTPHQHTRPFAVNGLAGLSNEPPQSSAFNSLLPGCPLAPPWTSVSSGQIPVYIDLTTMSAPIPDYVGAFLAPQQHVHKRPAPSSPASQRPSQRPRLESTESVASPTLAPRASTTASSHTHGYVFTPIDYTPSSTVNHAAARISVDAQSQGYGTGNMTTASHPHQSRHGILSGTADTPDQSRHGTPYKEAEDQLLYDLRVRGLSFHEIAQHFQGRTPSSLQFRWYSKIYPRVSETKTIKRTLHGRDSGLSLDAPTIATKRSSREVALKPFDEAEDQLLYDLRQRGVPWWQMTGLFQGRTEKILRIRYADKYGNPRDTLKDSFSNSQRKWPSGRGRGRGRDRGDSTTTDDEDYRSRSQHALSRRTTGGASKLQHAFDAVDSDSGLSDHSDVRPETDAGYSNVDARLLQISRRRELGLNPRQSRYSHMLASKDLAYQSLVSTSYIDDASGDIAAVAWAPNGQFFAGGGVVLSDESSMQYNRPRNLLIGDRAGTVRELSEHHIARPVVDIGVNALHSMRETQDPRLFSTVQAVSFSPDSQRLFSVSTDGKLNSYVMEGEHASSVRWDASFEHHSPVDLLSVSQNGLVATGARTSRLDSIKLFDSTLGSQSPLTLKLRSMIDSKHPSALKWGVAAHQRKYLLAGFSCDKQAQYMEHDTTSALGEACLINAETGTCLQFGMPRNVFDMAWNPRYGNSVYAVAYSRGSKVNEGMYSVVQLFGEGSDSKMRCFVELECPAHDINDVLYCPYDDNLVAAGSTDGRVYVWDSRFIKKSQDPVRSLSHGSCLSVLRHDQPRWESDTGIRFLSWGASRTQLYSGSSDGVLKCWNPYLASSDNHVADIATFSSAIMSGVFNHDYTSLIIGEDCSRMNLLEVGADPSSPPSRFDFISAPEQSISDKKPWIIPEPSEPEQSTSDKKPRLIPEPGPSASDEKPWQSLLDNEEIVFAPCGALPIRQAVQGPKYRPNKPLLTTQEAAVYASAQRFQNNLFHQRNRWKKTKRDLPGPKPAPCRLDCAYLPSAGAADDDGPEDSGRSADRIPEELGRRHAGVQALVRGLLVDCVECGANARPPGLGREARCERCGFACFRCGGRARLEPGLAREVGCGGCGLRWSVGVLGYTLVGGEDGRDGRDGRVGHDGHDTVVGLGGRSPPVVGREGELGDGEREEEFGDEEREEEFGEGEMERHFDLVTLRP